MSKSKQMNSHKETEGKNIKEEEKNTLRMKIQKCSHSYADESRMDCYTNYLFEDLILNSSGGSSTTLSGNIAKVCMMDKEYKMFVFENLSFTMVTQI